MIGGRGRGLGLKNGRRAVRADGPAGAARTCCSRIIRIDDVVVFFAFFAFLDVQRLVLFVVACRTRVKNKLIRARVAKPLANHPAKVCQVIHRISYSLFRAA